MSIALDIAQSCLVAGRHRRRRLRRSTPALGYNQHLSGLPSGLQILGIDACASLLRRSTGERGSVSVCTALQGVIVGPAVAIDRWSCLRCCGQPSP